jgi:hypothetical protein
MSEPITITCAICRRSFKVIPPPTFDDAKPYADVVKESNMVCWDCWRSLSQRKR